MASLFHFVYLIHYSGIFLFSRGADYMPGHDVRIYSALVGHVGSLRNLREVVELYTGKPVNMNYD